MISVAWGTTNIIFVPQSYLTFVSGTFYTMNTDTFRKDLKDLEDGLLEGMIYPDTHKHNTEYEVAGTTYARSIEIIAPYSVEFEDGQYSVRLEGSNNNIFDVENGILVQNQVQVIPTNSAGLIKVETGSAVLPSDIEDIADAVWDEPLADHDTDDTTGDKLKKNLKKSQFIGLK